MKPSLKVVFASVTLACMVGPTAWTAAASRVHPQWSEVASDLSRLDPLILPQLRKAMCFLVMEGDAPHAALIVRAPRDEFRGPVDEETPMRLHVDFYAGRQTDVFAVYLVIYDDPGDPFFKETWLSPYGKAIGPPDPLAEGSRERLEQLLRQDYARTLVVDENDWLMMVRTIEYTAAQKREFRKMVAGLDKYAGQKIPVELYVTGLQEYLNAVPLSELRSEFVSLLNEQ